jgi:hypothetical protein
VFSTKQAPRNLHRPVHGPVAEAVEPAPGSSIAHTFHVSPPPQSTRHRLGLCGAAIDATDGIDLSERVATKRNRPRIDEGGHSIDQAPGDIGLTICRHCSGPLCLFLTLHDTNRAADPAIARAEGAEIESYASTPPLESANPKLVPLETLLGRDDARFRAGEEPPWRGQIESRWGR